MYFLLVSSEPLSTFLCPALGPGRLVCRDYTTRLPFPLAWLLGGTSPKTGGWEREVKVLVSPTPALLGHHEKATTPVSCSSPAAAEPRL